MTFDTDYDEDVDVLTVGLVNSPMTFQVGYAPLSKTLYLKGDLHPLGEFPALMQAAKEHVPYISLGAMSALFPENWLRTACMGDLERTHIIDEIGKAVRA